MRQDPAASEPRGTALFGTISIKTSLLRLQCITIKDHDIKTDQRAWRDAGRSDRPGSGSPSAPRPRGERHLMKTQ